MNERSGDSPEWQVSDFAPTGRAAEETLHAIVLGDADAIVIDGKDGPRVYTLKDANEPYRHLIERMSEAAVVLAADGTILYCNGRLAALVGRAGLSGLSFLDLVAPCHHGNAMGLLAAGVERPATGEISVATADGRTVGLHVSAAPMPFDDRPCIALVLTVLGGIAALTASEAALRQSDLRFTVALANSPVVVFEQDRELRYTWICNPKLGYMEKEVIGKTDADLTDPASALQLEAVKRSVLETGQPLRREVAVARPGAAAEYYDLYVEPRRQDGGIVGVVCAAADITERKLAEVSLTAAKVEAERANNAKSRFLAAASHDLRQPLSALNLYIDALRDKFEGADLALLNNMKECAGSLSRLLTDLLDLSKLDARVITPNIESFPIAGTLARLVAMHAPEALKKGLSLRCADSRLTARTDPVLFQRMLGNLLANALRYTERGSVLIGCRRRQGKLWVEVWDTGIGIAEHQREEIFEEFRQLGDDARNRGSGLGLAIVLRMAALLKLEIRLRSTPGRGSMFAIEMPRGGKLRPPVRKQPDQRRLRIGLVEDHEQVRQALACALAGAGHDVLAAGSGAELFAHAGERPDILLSDYRLVGGETGFEVIAAARATFGDELPAILLTGDTDPDLIRSMANRDIVVQHKPIDLRALLDCIAALVKPTR